MTMVRMRQMMNVKFLVLETGCNTVAGRIRWTECRSTSFIQGGVTCLCGDDYGQNAPDDDCQVPCAGNKLQYCGGKNTVDVTPIYVVYTDSYLRQYMGCYKDTRIEAMEKKFSWPNAGNNTIESCIRHCAFNNYTYAGLQYGYDCFCGNSYDTYGPLPESRCNMTCSGNSSQICGGEFANSVYAVVTECSDDKDCERNESCNVVDLHYANVSRCRCRKGFHRINKTSFCTDIDECKLEGTSSPCNAFSEYCVNSIGSYACGSRCKEGFRCMHEEPGNEIQSDLQLISKIHPEQRKNSYDDTPDNVDEDDVYENDSLVKRQIVQHTTSEYEAFEQDDLYMNVGSSI